MFTPPSNNQVMSSASGVPSTQAVPATTSNTQCSLNNPFRDPTNQAAYQIPTAAVPPQNSMTNGAVHSVASSNPVPADHLPMILGFLSWLREAWSS